VKRALEDPDLRDDLVAAFAAARGIYEQMARTQGVRGKAEKVSDKRFQKQLQELIDELSAATERLKGEARRKKSHKTRNRVLLLTGVTLGVLYNPWTGPATREWIMDKIAGSDGGGFEGATTDVVSPATEPAVSAADVASSGEETTAETAEAAGGTAESS
ncbi:MAG: hypothetical protein RMM28_11895, partial [Thermoleophilia bacterium]|nr:hypothetical protein [Gaiellaceae bacterium]MDW8339829.1 hypothetical protein [Thermoleophilia bacterium]